jgi:hypothetical protein
VNALAPATEAAQRWNRTPEQQQMVADHIRMIRDKYSQILPEPLVALFLDETVWGTEELMEFLSVGKTRVFQLYGNGSRIAGPHPSGIPIADASAGTRGATPIRGIMAGRARWWAWFGKFTWDGTIGEYIPQTEINHGGRSPSHGGRR